MTDTPVMMLCACALASKFGFNDGDMPDFVFDRNLHRTYPHLQWSSALCKLVRKHLLPLTPGVEVVEISTSHNPIRATDEWKEFCENSDVSVEITYQQVLDVMEEGWK